jgi:hypothetical protein
MEDKNNGKNQSEGSSEIQKNITNLKRLKTDLSKVEQRINNSLDFLRVQMKYLLFDLEATKRENKELRRLLDEKKEK